MCCVSGLVAGKDRESSCCPDQAVPPRDLPDNHVPWILVAPGSCAANVLKAMPLVCEVDN